MPQRIGLYGGSFNPIHFGHLITSRAVAEQLRLDKIVLIPSAVPPHKHARDLAPTEHRLAMTRLAVQGDPLFEVSDIELHRPGPSYTIDTVQQFRGRLGPDVELSWLIGADTLPELVTWHRVAELVTRVRIITMARPGHAHPNLDPLIEKIGNPAVEALLSDCLITPNIEISATDIRRRTSRKLSINYLTHCETIRYIESHGLFTGP